MKKLMLLVAFAAICPMAGAASVAPGSQLPPVSGTPLVMAPLTVAQLTPQELLAHNNLPAGEMQLRYRYTRGYLRYCRRVVDATFPVGSPADRDPLNLPELPIDRMWDRSYLSTVESRDIVDVALGRKMFAQLQPRRTRPPV